MSSVKQWARQRFALPRSVIVLSMISFTVAVGFGVMLPVLPVFAQSFDVGAFEAAAVVSAFAFARLISAPVVGPLINRFGERPVLTVGMFIVAASTAVSALAGSYWEFLLWRATGGLGSAMFTVSAMTLVLNTVSPQLRGRASGLYMGGFLLGGMAGPGIGGALSAISLTAPFFFYAGALVVAGLIGLIVLRSSGLERHSESDDTKSFGQVIRDTRYQAALVAGLGQGWNSFGVRSALVPILVVEVLHHEPTWTGVAFTVSAIVQTAALGPAGRFVDVMGRRPAILGAGLVSAVGMLGVGFAPNVWVLIIALSVYGVGAAFLGTAPAAAVGDAAGGRSGTPVAVFSMVTDLGAILGPLAGGWIADHGSYALGFGVGAGILLLGSLMSLRMPKETPGGTGDPVAPAEETVTGAAAAAITDELRPEPSPAPSPAPEENR